MNVVSKPAAVGNYQVGRANQISRITYHHIVGDAPAAIARFQTPGVEVSATYVIGSDGTLYQCVSENNTPWTDANADSNSRAITIEHAGGIASVPYTDAMYQTSIQLTRSLIDRYGITDFKRHRDVSDTPTACPGELDVERIVNQAKELDMPVISREEVIWHYLCIFGAGPSETEINNYVGKDYHWATEDMKTYASNNKLYFQLFKDNANKQIADLKAQVAAAGTTPKDLAPGVYRVK